MVKVKRMMALLMALGLLFMFTACEPKAEEEATEPTATVSEENKEEAPANEPETDDDAISMDDWSGEWNSLVSYLDDPELEATFMEHAEEHGESLDEVKAEMREMFGDAFLGLKIEGDKVTFLDGKVDGGKEIETVEYQFVKSHEASHGGHTFFWHVFEAKGEAKHKILLMMPVHGEETMTHFHLRYGDDIQELLAKDDWYPTFVKPTTTYEQLAEEFGEHDHDHDHDHEHGDEAHDHEHEHEDAAPVRIELDDVNLLDWEGEWNSMSAYLNDAELEDALKAHAEAEGETVEEVKAEFLEKYKVDFETMVFDQDTVTFYDHRLDKEGKEIGKSTYTYVESYQVKHGKHDIEWHVFQGAKDAPYAYLLLMPVHGEETLAHFHMRLGDDVKELLEKEDWYPTFIKPSTTYEQLAEVFGPHDHDHDH